MRFPIKTIQFVINGQIAIFCFDKFLANLFWRTIAILHLRICQVKDVLGLIPPLQFLLGRLYVQFGFIEYDKVLSTAKIPL